MQKGDFSREGISGLLSFAYTNSYVHYGPIAAGASGTTVLAPINNAIAQYNAYTKHCATHPSAVRIRSAAEARVQRDGQRLLHTGRDCPLPRFRAAAVRSGDIANPYWNVTSASAGQYRPELPDLRYVSGLARVPAAQGFGSPYVATLLINYRHQKFAVTPSLQFQGGGKYGIPIAEAGIDPAPAIAVHAALSVTVIMRQPVRAW